MSTGQRLESFRRWASPRGPNSLGGRRRGVRAFLTGLGEGKGLAGLSPLLCPPAPPEQAAIAHGTVLGLPDGRVSGRGVGRHTFQVGVPLSEPVFKNQLQPCWGAIWGGLPPQAFFSFTSCPAPAPGEGGNYLEKASPTPLNSVGVSSLLGVVVPTPYAFPTHFQIAKNNTFEKSNVFETWSIFLIFLGKGGRSTSKPACVLQGGACWTLSLQTTLPGAPSRSQGMEMRMKIPCDFGPTLCSDGVHASHHSKEPSQPPQPSSGSATVPPIGSVVFVFIRLGACYLDVDGQLFER